MGWLEFQRNIEQWRWNMIIPQFCDVVWDWFVEAATIAGKREVTLFKPSWTPPAREMIDPNSETNAVTSQIRGGFMTLSEAIRQRGLEPKKVFEEFKKDHDLMDQMGLVFDTDPRKIMRAGMAQAPEALSAFTGTPAPADSQ
jgi:capsid protein